MNGTIRILAVSAAALLGLSATADAKPDSFKEKGKGESHTVFEGGPDHADFRHDSHQPDSGQATPKSIPSICAGHTLLKKMTIIRPRRTTTASGAASSSIQNTRPGAGSDRGVPNF